MPRKQNQKGFSVIEVTVTLFIVGVVFLIYISSVNSVTLNREMKDQEIATRIADTEIEILRNTPYASLPASGNISDSQLSNLPHGATEALTVSSYNSKTKQLTVAVTWTEAGESFTTSISVSTLMTSGGLAQ